MTTNRLVVTVEATHQSLLQRLDEAARPATRARPRERSARIDAFLAATSRHVAAVEEVLVREVRRRLPDGELRAATYLRSARALEHALTRLKARQYGEQHVAHLPMGEVLADAADALRRHDEEEMRLAQALAGVVEAGEVDDLTYAMYRAELRAPTRAHPHLPHRGAFGHAARRVWSMADRFWDAAENRVVPEPVRAHPKDHSHDSLMTQYVTSEPRFDRAAPVFGHHRR